MLLFDQPENAVYVCWYRQEVRVDWGRGEYTCLTTLFSSIPVPISSSCLSFLIFCVYVSILRGDLNNKFCFLRILEFPSLLAGRSVSHYMRS